MDSGIKRFLSVQNQVKIDFFKNSVKLGNPLISNQVKTAWKKKLGKTR